MRETGIDYAADLAGLDADQTRDYLGQHSGLPGPRGNLTLMAVAAELLPADLALELVASDEEYLACCGVATIGRLILEDPADLALPTLLATKTMDDRWRVREAVAIAAQRIGDDDPVRLRELVAVWVLGPDPLVIRAGIAAICEPRLLRDPLTAAAALDACAQATAALVAVPAMRRSDPRVRVLRQGLAYCWSVAVAGSPTAGMPKFLALDCGDPDVAWLVKQNLTKQRLKKLLAT